MTVGAVKSFNKGILLGLARLDKLEFNPFFLTPTHEHGRPKFAAIVQTYGFGQAMISSNCSSVLTTLAAGKLISISIANTSRLDSSMMFRVLKGLP